LTRSKALNEKRQTIKSSSNNRKQKTEHMTNNIMYNIPTPTDGKENQNGIAKLILTIIKILTDLLERQAQRKVMEGNLANSDMERLGLAFINIRETLYNITRQYGFEENELGLSLGSADGRAFGSKLKDRELLSETTLVDILDKLINKKTVIAGEITISVAEIDLIVLNLLAQLSSKDEYIDNSKLD
jgi:Gas vesicle protein K/Gas vesicle protein